MLFPILGPSSLPIVVAQPNEYMQTEQFLCWSGMTGQSIQHLVQTKKKGTLILKVEISKPIQLRFLKLRQKLNAL